MLARIPKTDLLARLALVSCVFEHAATDPIHLERFVWSMGLPPRYRNKLLPAARSGQPILDPKSLRWVLTEIAAAENAELAARASWRPEIGSEEWTLAMALELSCLFGGGPPSWQHFRMALWLLGDSFHGADQPLSHDAGVLSGITALGYATTQPGAWLPLLDRWRAIWSVPDDHRAVRASAKRPSLVRAAYGAKLRIDPVACLAGVSFIGLRWWLSFRADSVAKGLPVPVALEQLRSLGVGPGSIRLSVQFAGVLQDQLLVGVEEFCADVRAKARNYTGIGSLPQTDPLAIRNHPMIEFPGGVIIPVSLNMLAERAAILHRWLLNTRGAREANTSVGYLFEAYIDDVLSQRASQSHRVLSEADITAVLGHDSRCDLALINGTDWLFVETSLQTVARTVATGDVSGIDALCERYHAEADQAEETAVRAGELAAAYGLPKPTTTTYIVVVDNSAPHSPALMRRMHELRPGRNPRFVVSSDELEWLAKLAERGWSLPAAVRRWRAQAQEGPISIVSAELCALMRPRIHPTQADLDEWHAQLPLDAPPKVA